MPGMGGSRRRSADRRSAPTIGVDVRQRSRGGMTPSARSTNGQSFNGQGRGAGLQLPGNVPPRGMGGPNGKAMNLGFIKKGRARWMPGVGLAARAKEVRGNQWPLGEERICAREASMGQRMNTGGDGHDLRAYPDSAHVELGADTIVFPRNFSVEEASMIRTASALLVGLTIAAGQASAAPYSGGGSASEFPAATRFESVRCYGAHCRARVHGYRANGYRSRWHTQDPRHMRTGSQRWWDAKDREGSTGRP